MIAIDPSLSNNKFLRMITLAQFNAKTRTVTWFALMLIAGCTRESVEGERGSTIAELMDDERLQYFAL